MPVQTKRKIETIDFSAGQRKTRALDHDGVCTELLLRLRGTMTTSGTAPATPKKGDYLRLIRSLELVAMGRDTIINITGEQLLELNRKDFGINPFGYGAAAVNQSTANDFDIVFRLPFYMPNARVPDDCALDLRKISQATLVANFGSESDVYKTVNGAVLSNVSLDIEQHFHVGVPEDKMYMVRELSRISQPVSASNDNLATKIDGNTGCFIRSVMAIATDDDIAESDILETLELKAGSFVYCKRDAEVVRADNQIKSGLEANAGVYHFDSAKFEEASYFIQTASNVMPAAFVANSKVAVGTGTTLIDFVVERIRPMKVAA